MQKKLLIVEEALRDCTGHWYAYNKAVVDMHRESGCECLILANKDIDAAMSSELGAVPYFPYTNWDGIYNSPKAWKRYAGVIQHNLRVYQAMRKHFNSVSHPYDCVFVPTVVIHHLLAWRWLVAKYGGKKFKRLVLFFRINAGRYNTDSRRFDFKRNSIIMRTALHGLRKAVDEGIVCLATDSTRLAEEYRQLSGMELKVFPHPAVNYTHAFRPPDSSKTGLVTFTMLGPARFEKGIEVLQKSIRKILMEYPDLPVRFVIQWNRPIYLLEGGEYCPDPVLEASEKVVFIRQDLSTEEYDRYLSEADCILLPYRIDSYYSRISGVLIEAAMAGKPMIVTGNTWMEDAAQQYGHALIIQDGDVDGLASRIVTMCQEKERHSRLACERAVLACNYHSPGNFMNSLWQEK